MSGVSRELALATAAYGANVALGLAVAARLLDTSSARWVHHGLYITTIGTTCLAVALGGVRRDPAAVVLAPALAPLALLPRRGSRPLGRHAGTALLAAPCYAAALLLTRR